MNNIAFKPRWREELEAISTDGTLIFEITMGTLHVYFPDLNRWRAIAPGWAKEKWKEYSESCHAWCKQNKIPISIVGDAHFYEEKSNS